MVWKQGTGERKLVVFADPNCGYCKKFESDLQAVKDVTVYTFLYPILGGDSPEKSKAIWCAKDNTKAWRDWMIKGTLDRRQPAVRHLGAAAQPRPRPQAPHQRHARAWSSRTASTCPARPAPMSSKSSSRSAAPRRRASRGAARARAYIR